MSGKRSPLGEVWGVLSCLSLSFIPIPFLSHPSLISPDPFAHFSRFPSLIGILYKRRSVKAGGQKRDILNEGRTLLQRQFAHK